MAVIRFFAPSWAQKLIFMRSLRQAASENMGLLQFESSERAISYQLSAISSQRRTSNGLVEPIE